MTDRLSAMRAFVAVCDAGGFAAAARKLDLSPSAITRSISFLEDRLSVRLLQRTTRSLKLTEAGARYLARTRNVLAEIEEAELSAQAGAAHPKGRLVVAAPLLFGRMHAAPLVSAFLDAYPETTADLRLSDAMSNLIDDGIDVALRIGTLDDTSLISRILGRTRRVLVASPRYLSARGGEPRTPAELQTHRLIAFTALTPSNGWSFVGPAGEQLSVNVEPNFSTNTGEVAIDRAMADGGIAAAFCYQIAEQLRTGSLVEVLKPFGPPPVAIQAVFPTARFMLSRVRAFIDLAVAAGPNWSFLA